MYDGIPASKYKREILYVDCSYHTSKLTHNTPMHKQVSK